MPNLSLHSFLKSTLDSEPMDQADRITPNKLETLGDTVESVHTARTNDLRMRSNADEGHTNNPMGRGSGMLDIISGNATVPRPKIHSDLNDPPQPVNNSDETLVQGTSQMPRTPSSLAKYRPEKPIPEFRCAHTCVTQHLPLSKYSLPVSQWPHYREFYQNRIHRFAESPPNSEPLHEQVKHYVMKWAVWVSMVDDAERRKELLWWVMEKMESVWRYGLNEEFGRKQCQGDAANGSNTSSIEKPKKRRKVEADDTWLFSDGLPIFLRKGRSREKGTRVLESEILSAGVSPQAVMARAESGDFEGGEDLLDLTYMKLGRDEIYATDWKSSPGFAGRDLLMYALHEVQSAKAEKRYLDKLRRSFPTAKQKQNTLNRIIEQSYIEKHFMALALEIYHHRKKEDEYEQEGQGDILSGEPVPSEVINTIKNMKEIRSHDHELKDDWYARIANLIETSEEAVLNQLAKRLVVTQQPRDMLEVLRSINGHELLVTPSEPASFRKEPEDTNDIIPRLIVILETLKRKLLGNRQRQGHISEYGSRSIPKQGEAEFAKQKASLKIALQVLEEDTPGPGFMMLDHSEEESQQSLADRGADCNCMSQQLKLVEPAQALEALNYSTKPNVMSGCGMDNEKQENNTSENQITSQNTGSNTMAGSSLTVKGRHHHLRNTESPPATLFSSTAEKRSRYRNLFIVPKLNAMLCEAGLEKFETQNVIKWKAVREQLRRLGLDVQQRNEWYHDFVGGYEAWDELPFTSATASSSASDSKRNCPKISIVIDKRSTMSEAKFPGGIVPTSDTNRPSKIVTLRVPRDFNPADSELDTSLKTYKNFHFRFTPFSLLREREAIHDSVRAFVRERMKSQATWQAKYVTFCLPYGDRKTVAHGIFDVRKGVRPTNHKAELFFTGDLDFDEEGVVIWESCDEADGGRNDELEKDAKVRKEKSKKGRKRKSVHFCGDDGVDTDYVPG